MGGGKAPARPGKEDGWRAAVSPPLLSSTRSPSPPRSPPARGLAGRGGTGTRAAGGRKEGEDACSRGRARGKGRGRARVRELFHFVVLGCRRVGCDSMACTRRGGAPAAVARRRARKACMRRAGRNARGSFAELPKALYHRREETRAKRQLQVRNSLALTRTTNE